MAIQDSNPERRNLSLLSISIITFYAAGGEVIDNVVRFQIINVGFHKPEVLAYFVWGILCWFCFRYWLLNRDGWKKELFKEMVDTSNYSFLLHRHIVKKFGLGTNFSRSYYVDKHWVALCPKGPLGLVYQHIFKDDTGSQQSETKDINTLLDKILLTLFGATMFFRKPTLSGYFVPYFLFLSAVLLGVQSRF